MNKRGNVTWQFFIKTIFSVMTILVFLYFGSKAYAAFFGSADVDNAKALIDELKATLDYMQEKNLDYETLLINNPRDWYIFTLEENGAKFLCVCEELKYPDSVQREYCGIKGEGYCDDESLKYDVVFEDINSATKDASVGLEAAKTYDKNSIKIKSTTLAIKKFSGEFLIYSDVSEYNYNFLFKEFLAQEFKKSELTKELYEEDIWNQIPETLTVEEYIGLFCNDMSNFLSAFNIDFKNKIESFFNLDGAEKIFIGIKPQASLNYPKFYYPSEFSINQAPSGVTLFNSNSVINLNNGGTCDIIYYFYAP